MDETVGGVVFVMLLIQVMSMYENAKRIDHLEKVIALQLSASDILTKSIYAQLDDQKNYRLKSREERISEFQEIDHKLDEQFKLIADLTRDGNATMHAQVQEILDEIHAVQIIRKKEYSDMATQNKDQFTELLSQLMTRTSGRVTRRELNAWSKELQGQFPAARIPLIPEIDAPKDLPFWHIEIPSQ